TAGVAGKHPPPGPHAGSSQWQQRSSTPAETETDRRQNPAGDRGSTLEDREGHVRHLPRLPRANRRSAAERDPLDARLHRVQGKAEHVTDLLTVLQDFYREKLTMLLAHEAGAKLVGQYDVNNTYQYIINREEAQLSWVA